MSLPMTAQTHDSFILVETREDLAQCVEWLSQQESVCLDTEATDKVPRTATPLLLQLGADDGELVYVIDLTRFSTGELSPVFSAIRKGRILVIGHNLAYDYKLLRYHYPNVRFTRVYDTQLIEQLLTSGDYPDKGTWLKATSLKSLARKYLGLELDKEVRESFIGADPGTFAPDLEQLEYGAKDVSILPDIVHAQYEQLEEQGMMRAALLRCGALVPLCEVEMRGMRIDQDAWREYIADLESQREEVQHRLETILTPYELRFREEQYFQMQQELNRWEQERDQYLELVTLRFQTDEEALAWGAYKNEHMKAWREDHPRPKRPVLDLSAINLNSHAQVLRSLRAMGFDLDSTNRLARAKALRGDLTPEQREVLETFAQYTKLSKYISAFGENILAMIVPETGRLHTSYNIGLTGTGRMSSQNPNFQNFPRDNAIRHAFISDPGTRVITADFKGQELAISAALSQDPVMMTDILTGKDLYRLLAVDVFHCSLDDVTKEQRQMCKSALLGITYGLTAVGMERQYGIQQKLGSKILEQIQTRYKTMVEWANEMSHLAMTRGYVTTATGARRFFRDRSVPTWEIQNQGKNAPVQGTAAEIVYRLSWRFEKFLVPKQILPVNYVHDESVSLAPMAIADEAAELVVVEMQQSFLDILPYDTYGMRIEVDVHVDDFWTK